MFSKCVPQWAKAWQNIWIQSCLCSLSFSSGSLAAWSSQWRMSSKVIGGNLAVFYDFWFYLQLLLFFSFHCSIPLWLLVPELHTSITLKTPDNRSRRHSEMYILYFTEKIRLNFLCVFFKPCFLSKIKKKWLRMSSAKILNVALTLVMLNILRCRAHL